MDRAVPCETVTCCIVGGGPAGVFLGFLLARAGVDVLVLEKHKDFLRDFRGDTIHPSTFELLHELGLLDKFMPLVDFHAATLKININGREYVGPDFSHLRATCPFMGFVPQWDFLNFISSEARAYPQFDLRMNTRAVDVLRESGRVVGVRCESEEGSFDIRANLVVAADGRVSTIRSAINRKVEEVGIPIDVLWFRLERPAEQLERDVEKAEDTLGWIRDGRMLVTIPRRDHFQVAMIIKKGAFPELQRHGLDTFRDIIASVCPPMRQVVSSIHDWQEVKLLSVQINRLEQWYEDGLLFIGDAAHAMSPVGGVGINLAIQDAVATANIVAEPLRTQTLVTKDLRAGNREGRFRRHGTCSYWWFPCRRFCADWQLVGSGWASSRSR